MHGTQYIGYLRAYVPTVLSLNRVRLVDGVAWISIVVISANILGGYGKYHA